MPERFIRFGVTNHAGARSSTWKCWSQVGSGKTDVYVTCRALGGVLKLSMHESGRWHIAFDSSQFPGLFNDHMRPENRFVTRMNRPLPLVQGVTLACRVEIPSYGVSIPAPKLEKSVVWVSAPEPGESIEFAVMFTEPSVHVTDWPTKRSMGTDLAGTFKLDNGSRVWAVHRRIATAEPRLPSSPTPRYFKGIGKENLQTDGLRAVTWFTAPDDSVCFFEGPVLINPRGGACQS
ncbi:hypothetical protein [Simplicispira suum]|uniref:hypothetical protein n=1 Tax=Simplicispira suum TaxID=2109915 RepID=UPI0011B21784|nr:hypothetical protein [Simplicispira suum]